MKVIACGNQKGGCAKTTTVLNVCYSLANTYGYKVLMIDFDSQASASQNLQINPDDEDYVCIADLLIDYVENPRKKPTWDEIKTYIRTPTYKMRVRDDENKMKWVTVDTPYGFDVIPSSLQLSYVEFQMGIKGGYMTQGKNIYAYYLRDILDIIDANSDYDYCVIDTPPALSSLSMNAIAAAKDGVIIPTNMDIMSYRGIMTFIDAVKVMEDTNPKHKGVIGIQLALYSERRKVDKTLGDYASDFYPVPVFKSTIPDSNDATKANLQYKLFSQINKSAKIAFDNLTKEIIEKTQDDGQAPEQKEEVNG